MSNSPFTKIDKELSLSEKIAQEILEAIRKKFFLPGDKILGEHELAENFGVSRTAVREALHRLAGKGVVEIRKNSGVFVSPDHFSPVTDSLYHLLEMKCGGSRLLYIASTRLIIEPEVARQAAENASDKDISHMEESYSKMGNFINDPEKMIKYDIDFHRSIAGAAKNPIFPVIMEPLFQLMTKFISEVYKYSQSPVQGLKAHKDILECIKAKDSEGAFLGMKNHMIEAYEHAKIFSEKQVGETFRSTIQQGQFRIKTVIV